MTANVTFGNNFSGAESYQANKVVNGVNQSKLIYFKNVAPEYQTNKKNELEIKPLSIAKDMKNHVKSEKTRVQKPVMNVSFNFHKSENLTNDQMSKACLKALEHVGINQSNHQITIRRHYDTAHPHAHVTVNRVGLDGKVHDNSFIANRLQVACDRVEKEQELRPTKGRIFVFDPTTEKGYRKQTKAERTRTAQPKTKKQRIQAVNEKVKTEVSASLKTAKDWNELKSDLEKKGIELDVKTNKNGVYGMSFKHDNIAVKASKLGIKVKDTKKIFAENYKEYNRAKTIEKHEIKDLVEREIKEGIKEYKTIYAENSKKIDRYKNMMNEKMISKKSSQELAEKYDLKEKPFLDDLNALDKAYNESTAKVEKIAQERENTYKTLMNTKEEKSGIFTSSQKKAEIESRNRELRLSRSDARMNLLNEHEKVALKGQFVNERLTEITGQRISAMRENTRNEIKDLENYYKVALNVDLRAEIAKREQTRSKDQEKEQNREKSRGYGR